MTAQQHVLLVDAYQEAEATNSSGSIFIKLPSKQVMPIVGGLNDWDGMNNYLNVFGSKLIIERKDIGSDGVTHLILRREDGLNFFDLFPTLKARLVPITSLPNLKEAS